jgi:hypothetical protein
VGQALRGHHPALEQRLGRVIPFLDYDVEIRTVICSTNVFFAQALPGQKKRRTCNWITTSRPATAVSASRRS